MSRLKTVSSPVGLIALAAVFAACGGTTGKNGASCSVKANADGGETVSCTDGTTATVKPGTSGASGNNGQPGTNGNNGALGNNGNNGAPGTNGTNGSSCTVVALNSTTNEITCSDGSTVTVSSGTASQGIQITDIHGSAALAAQALTATGMYVANVSVLAASVNASNQPVVTFSVANGTAPVTGLTVAGSNLSFNIAKLTPPETNSDFNQWVPYIWQTETAGTGGAWSAAPFGPNGTGTPAAAFTYQGYREPCAHTASQSCGPNPGADVAPGTLVENPPGTYTYTFTTILGTTEGITQSGTTDSSAWQNQVGTINYDATLRHRISVMLGGKAGPTGTATIDFIPNGTPVTAATDSRDIMRTENCQQCHGPQFAGHEGDRRTVESCVTCHAPGGRDAQSGESLDFKVMVHKIHAGSNLLSSTLSDGASLVDSQDFWAAGPDFATWAVPGPLPNMQWGYKNTEEDWWKIAFPAVISNCTKCHQIPTTSPGTTVVGATTAPAGLPSAASVDQWETVPSKEACTSCHDNLSFGATTGFATHSFANPTDATCQGGCHQPAPGVPFSPGTSVVPVAQAHDSITRWTNPTTPGDTGFFPQDLRNVPEFAITLSIAGASGGSGAYFQAGDTPSVKIAISDLENLTAGAPTPIDCTVPGNQVNCQRIAAPALAALAANGTPAYPNTTANTCALTPGAAWSSGSLGSPAATSCPPVTAPNWTLTASSFYVHGPRANQSPAFTTVARAALVSAAVDSGSGFSLTGITALGLSVDGGGNVEVADAYGDGTLAAGVFSVPVPGKAAAWAASTTYTAGTFVSASGNLYVCTTAGISGTVTLTASAGTAISDGGATWQFVTSGWTSPASVPLATLVNILNSRNPNNLPFVYRADAFADPNDAGRLVIRSRNLGYVHAIAATGTAASDLNALFNFDTSTYLPDSVYQSAGGTISSAGNTLAKIPAWVPGQQYAAGAYVWNAGNDYQAYSATGTSAAVVSSVVPPGPTGTAPSITTDGTVTWHYLAPTIAPAWLPGTSYVAGTYVSNAGNTYLSVTAGSSLIGAGPHGFANVSPITDGSVTWNYVAPAGVDLLAAAPAWAAVAYAQNAYVVNGGNIYQCATPGTSVAPGPTGTTSPFTDAGGVVWNDLGPSTANSTWAKSTAYAKGAYVVNGLRMYTATSAGTSAALGVGPAGIGAAITDGTVTWKYVPQAMVDPKVIYTTTGMTYTMDPVLSSDAPGTYIVGVQFGSRGNSGAPNFYKTPSVAFLPFQVGTATQELPVARNCSTCHEAPDQSIDDMTAGDYAGQTPTFIGVAASTAAFRGFVFDPVRHYKMFADRATDQCTSCHDYQPGNLTANLSVNSWTGAFPISHRVHAVHNGAALNFPVATVGENDAPIERDWRIPYPQNIRECETCHVDGTTTGTWAYSPSRIPCVGCHDSLAAQAHMTQQTFDPTPAAPFSGDEVESCAVCHASVPYSTTTMTTVGGQP